MPLATKTYGGNKLEPFMDPNYAITEARTFAANLTVAKGQVIATATATGKSALYAGGGAGGLETADGIAMYAFTTDGSGNVVFDTDAGETYLTAPVYIRGYFRTTELVGLDAGGITDIGKLERGTLADGVLHVR